MILDNIDKYIYTNKFNHIYLYGPVNDVNVLNIKQMINKFDEEHRKNTIRKQPKKIILHINSFGGFLESGINLMNIIDESNVPIIALVEGVSASASTMVLVKAKYRIIAPNGLVLIHQHGSSIEGKYNKQQFEAKISKDVYDFLLKLYKKTTVISSNALSKLLSSDIWMTAKDCYDYKLVDKILAPPKLKFDFQKTITPTLYNNIYLYDTSTEYKINSKTNADILDNPVSKSLKELHNILAIDNNVLNNINAKTNPVLLHISGLYNLNDIYTITSFVNTIIMSNIPIYSIIESFLSNIVSIIAIVCHKRFMFAHSSIYIDYVYMQEKKVKYDDSKYNTIIVRNLITNLYKKYTKLPPTIIKTLFTKRYNFNANDCIKYGLVDIVIQ